MKRIKKILSWAIILVAVSAMFNAVSAQVFLHNPTWEVPGGYSQVSSGISASAAGGKTWTYYDFIPTAYTALYYVMGDYDYDPGPPEVWTFNTSGPTIGTARNGITRLTYALADSDLDNGRMVWSGTIYIYDAANLLNQLHHARFVLTVNDATGEPASLVDALTLPGMDPAVGGAYSIVGDFTANWQFELSASGTHWEAALTFFDALRTAPSDSLRSSVAKGFYYTPSPDDPPGDFDNDSDVDGEDAAALADNLALLDLPLFAWGFGMQSAP